MGRDRTFLINKFKTHTTHTKLGSSPYWIVLGRITKRGVTLEGVLLQHHNWAELQDMPMNSEDNNHYKLSKVNLHTETKEVLPEK